MGANLTEREKVVKRLQSQRRALRKTIKLFARQLDSHLAELVTLADIAPPRRPLRRAGEAAGLPRPDFADELNSHRGRKAT
jgi:hypothetical protein